MPKLRGIFRKSKSNTSDTIDKLDKSTQTKEAYKRSVNYSNILDSFAFSTKWTIYMKMVFKAVFFLGAITLIVIITKIFIQSTEYVFDLSKKLDKINDNKFEIILSVLTIILPAASSFVVAFLKIAEIIAKYLFNTEEERYMDSIIKNIQDYDREMFIATQQKIVESLLKNKNNKETDDEFDDFDNMEDESKRQETEEE